jgi:hypothetical protein
MRERRYPLHYRDPPRVEARRDGTLLIVDCPYCHPPHYHLPREGGFGHVVRAHCRRNRRCARPELVYRLVASRADLRDRAREVIVELLQRLTELSPSEVGVLMREGVGWLVVERCPQ